MITLALKFSSRGGKVRSQHAPINQTVGQQSLSRQIFQFRLSLDGIKPPIWRRILVPADFTLSQLHRVIQAVMDWKDYHLHEFNVAGRVYGIPDPDGDLEFIDDRKVRLRDLSLST